ncbi:HAD family hydrolase [Agrobacterium deltaense]|uniref:HAD family hydrolase n=1 Tax=Agrobacterium deltaense TaxID=1183412 RepID=UPI0009BB374F|nr:HAD family hydrolase [Agrobacterium deltaense]CUX40641.1 HAD-superfamily hydrolase, subfamily IA, variant 1 [Agrobacterium deltaense RV3]
MNTSAPQSETIEHILKQPVEYADIDIDRYQGVLLDLDDTLYRYEPCHQAALAQCFARNSLGLSELAYNQTYREARNLVTARLYPQGVCRSRLFAFQMMCEDAKVPRPFSAALDLDEVYWTTFLSNMKIDASADAFLIRCAARNLPVCVVTDMTAHVQIKKLHALGIDGAISSLVTSEEIGAEKPDPRMFLKGLEKLGTSTKHTIMLGDSFSKDVQGALAAGIQARLIKLQDQ